MKELPDFYLSSSDGYGLKTPRDCFRIKRLNSNSRDDLLLVRITPPLIGSDYEIPVPVIDHVIVATRHKGSTLFPINKWPVYVYVAALTSIESLEHITTISIDSLKIIAWAELYKTREDAIDKKM